MSQGKYFVLVSKLSGHVVGPEGGREGEGVKLVTCQRNDSDDRLCWYTDPLNGTIRNKKTGLCLHIGGSCDATVNKYLKGQACQQFVVDGPVVRNRIDGRVLDISGGNNPGAALCVWAYHGGPNQQFDCVFQQPKYFLLKGVASGKVIDIMEANKAAWTKICIYDASNGDNQLWYEDKNGLVRSKLNDFVFDGSTSDITMHPYEPSNPNRSWVLAEAAVAMLSNPNKVLEVRGESKANGATICANDNKNAGHQKWSVVYV